LNSVPLHHEPPFDLAGYHVNPATLRVTRGHQETRLEAKAMQVLVYLVKHAGEVVGRADLERHVWPGLVVTEDSLTNAIAKLRRALHDDARHPRLIETVPKIGYRLMAPLNAIDSVREEAGDAGAMPSRPARRSRKWVAGLFSLLLLPVLAGVVVMLERSGRLAGVPGAQKPTVAILPFENLGMSVEHDYFANGMTSDLITDLSKVSGLSVIAPGSVFAYEDSQATLSDIFNELQAGYVVVGSVQHLGNRFRANVQLMAAPSERAIWAERYEGTLEDLFAVQDQMISALTSALKVELAPLERAILAKRPTTSIAAYDEFLRGLEAHGHRTSDENSSAKLHFRRALSLDPAFARAYAGLAMAFSRDAIDGWTGEPLKALEKAKALADQAAAIDPAIPQVHFITGQVELFRHHHDAAVRATERATAINPNYADAYALRAWILSYAGRTDEALVAMRKALSLNPRPTASYLEVLGEIQFVRGEYAESVKTLQQVLEINPVYMRARMWLITALAHQAQLDEAAWEAAQLKVANPDFSISQLEFAFPFRDPRDLYRLLYGLRLAGLDE